MAKRLLVLVISLTLVMFLAAGCKSSSTTAAGGGVPATSTASASAAPTACPSEASGFAKTKFVAHAALGFGAFHRYIYKPYRAGTFRSGAHGRLVAFIKAGLAALFIKREIRLAFAAAQNSPALCKLVVSPMRTVSETCKPPYRSSSTVTRRASAPSRPLSHRWSRRPPARVGTSSRTPAPHCPEPRRAASGRA